MFEYLPLLPSDPILGLMQKHQQDPRAEKIDLGVGVFRDDSGHTPVLESVKRAEAILQQHEQSKSYLGPAGNTGFNEKIQTLALGEKLSNELADRTVFIQTPGGCGALRVAAELAMRAHDKRAPRVWVSDPTWGNHVPLLGDAGLKISTYPYYDFENRQVDFKKMLKFLEEIPQKGDLLLLHASCHNPSGADLTIKQWDAIAQLCAHKGLVPFVDMAYQGFGDGLQEDAYGLRTCIDHNNEVLVVYSCSKNFGLYRERAGAIGVVSATPEQSHAVKSQVYNLVRGIYSMPPAHGAAVVDTILASPELARLWEQELDEMRARIGRMRTDLTYCFKQQGQYERFAYIENEKGMFSFLGLSQAQTEILAKQFGIYMVGSSRINVAGLKADNIERFVDCVCKVM